MPLLLISADCDKSLLFKSNCTEKTIAVGKGNNTEWSCEFKAPHESDFPVSVVLNKTISLPHFNLTGKEDLDAICATFKQPSAMYDVVAEPLHRCYSRYDVRVVVCSTNELLTGDYSVVWDDKIITEGSRVDVKLPPQSTAPLQGEILNM